MQTNVHLVGKPNPVIQHDHADSDTHWVELGEDRQNRVIVFVDGTAALEAAYAFVSAYQAITGKGITEAVHDIVGAHNDACIEALTA